jgi:hypothetical protein
MIIQSENPIRMVRELKGAPLSIVMVLSLVTQRVTQEFLERATGYTDKPVSQALAYLQEVGLADHTHAGWQLIKENIKQLPLTMQIEEDAVEEQGIEEGNCPVEDRPDQHQEQSVLSRNYSDSLTYLSKEVVVNINNIKNTSTNLLNLTEKDGKIPTSDEIQRVLDAAAGLFGRPIMGDVQDYADIERLLSWIAQAFKGCYESGRLKIMNPAGLVYWAFHQGKGKVAEKKYLEDPGEYLPESFLRASGQWEFEDDLRGEA